jgi:hypothetical protein
MRIVLLMAAAVLLPRFASADEAEPGPVLVKMQFSVMSYDPADPQGTLTVAVRNNSDRPLYLSGQYDGGQIVIYGNGLHLRPVRNEVRGKPAAELPKGLTIEPGREATLCELPLADILKGARDENASWYWDWQGRPEPPHSPIHRWRKPGYHASATFHAEIRLGELVAKSAPCVLKVDSADAKPRN